VYVGVGDIELMVANAVENGQQGIDMHQENFFSTYY
jgi:hypothetical protein